MNDERLSKLRYPHKEDEMRITLAKNSGYFIARLYKGDKLLASDYIAISGSGKTRVKAENLTEYVETINKCGHKVNMENKKLRRIIKELRNGN